MVLRAALFQDRHASFFVEIFRWSFIDGRGGLVDGSHDEEEGLIAWIDGLCLCGLPWSVTLAVLRVDCRCRRIGAWPALN